MDMSEQQHTELGTPCAPNWDEDWIALVNDAEREKGERICGARTVGGVPCPLGSTHTSGRCRFHGGFDMTGGQPGNRNAVVHGLYSRALRPCGPHCTQWESCPFAGKDVEAVKGAVRPICPYEQGLFDNEVEQLTAQYDSDPERPLRSNLIHQCALMAVLMTRAVAAMAESSMVDFTKVVRNLYSKHTAQPNARVQAYLRISAEYRRYIKLLQGDRRGKGVSEQDTSNEPLLSSSERRKKQRRTVAGDSPDPAMDNAPGASITGPGADEPETDLEFAQRMVEQARDWVAAGRCDIAILRINEALLREPTFTLGVYDEFEALWKEHCADNPKAVKLRPRPKLVSPDP